MPEYRRFIAYFYEYIDGKKQNNAGFAKVELRNGIWRILLRLTAEPRPLSPIRIYGFVREKDSLPGFSLGTIRPVREIAEEWAFRADAPIGKNSCRLEELAGIWAESADGRCFVTVWDDEGICTEKFAPEMPEPAGTDAEPQEEKPRADSEAETEQADAAAERTKTGQADAAVGGAESVQANVAAGGIKTGQANAAAGGTKTEQASAATGKIEVIQANAAAERTKTGQADAAVGGAEADQVDTVAGGMKAAQADAAAGRIEAAQVNAVTEGIKTRQANVAAERTKTGQVDTAAGETEAGRLGLTAEEVGEEEPDCSTAVVEELFQKRPRFQPFANGEISDCVMIQPCDIVRLQQENWQAGRSSFLQHAYYQHRHLMLGRDNKGAYILGVPGVRNAQEIYMAGMFGFDDFKMSGRQSGMEFGYWCRVLKHCRKETVSPNYMLQGRE